MKHINLSEFKQTEAIFLLFVRRGFRTRFSYPHGLSLSYGINTLVDVETEPKGDNGFERLTSGQVVL